MNIGENIISFFNNTGWRILVALCIIVAGGIAIHFLAKILKYILYKTPIDNSVVAFIVSVIKMILCILIIFADMIVLNVSTSSLLVCLSSIALAVGLALKDSLSNLTNGLFIIYNKPFKRGDHIKIDGIEGLVQNIKLLSTELVTFDNRKLIIPNSKFTTESIVNYTTLPRRRIDMTFGVAYGTNMDYVQKIIEQALDSYSLILKNPRSSVFICNHGSSSVDWSVWVWVATDDYWTVWKALPKIIYQAFENANISIPFNQIDVHFDKENIKGEAIKQLKETIKESSSTKKTSTKSKTLDAKNKTKNAKSSANTIEKKKETNIAKK